MLLVIFIKLEKISILLLDILELRRPNQKESPRKQLKKGKSFAKIKFSAWNGLI